MNTDDFELKRPLPPWTKDRGLASVLEAWSEARGASVVMHEVIAGRDGTYADFPETLHPAVQEAMRGREVMNLYAHQAEAFVRAREGQHIVVATPTASGKSLCYNLPVLDALAREPDARALYLFPTKALSRDQEVALRALMKETGLSHAAITYDGDTPGDARRAARDRSDGSGRSPRPVRADGDSAPPVHRAAGQGALRREAARVGAQQGRLLDVVV